MALAELGTTQQNASRYADGKDREYNTAHFAHRDHSVRVIVISAEGRDPRSERSDVLDFRLVLLVGRDAHGTRSHQVGSRGTSDQDAALSVFRREGPLRAMRWAA